MIVFRITDCGAGFGVLSFSATSTISGELWLNNSFSTDLTAVSKNFYANGSATQPTPAANDPNPRAR